MTKDSLVSQPSMSDIKKITDFAEQRIEIVKVTENPGRYGMTFLCELANGDKLWSNTRLAKYVQCHLRAGWPEPLCLKVGAPQEYTTDDGRTLSYLPMETAY